MSDKVMKWGEGSGENSRTKTKSQVKPNLSHGVSGTQAWVLLQFGYYSFEVTMRFVVTAMPWTGTAGKMG
jgi:hypothetical protein